MRTALPHSILRNLGQILPNRYRSSCRRNCGNFVTGTSLALILILEDREQLEHQTLFSNNLRFGCATELDLSRAIIHPLRLQMLCSKVNQNLKRLMTNLKKN